MFKNWHKEQILEWILIVFFGLCTFFLFFIYCIAPDGLKSISLDFAIFCFGFLVSTIILLIGSKRAKPIKSGDVYNELVAAMGIVEKIGIVQMYHKRRDSDDDGYLHDLLNEFESAAKWHTSKDKPIKILCLALDNDLLTAKIQNVIGSKCRGIAFHILICDEGNRELESRLRFVNGKFEKLTNDRDWMCTSFENTPLFAALTTARDKINELGTQNRFIDTCKYSFSPFATIVIINDHIYYTPNVIAYSNYVKLEQLSNECKKKYIYDAELSLRIQRESEFGCRLEKLFESLWENEENEPIPKAV